MLNKNDKVYLHIGDLKKSIDKSNFNKTRLCKIVDIKKTKHISGEMIGIYTLKAIYDNDREYTVMSNDKLWKISSMDSLIEAVKQSKYNPDTINAIIDLINNS